MLTLSLAIGTAIIIYSAIALNKKNVTAVNNQNNVEKFDGNNSDEDKELDELKRLYEAKKSKITLAEKNKKKQTQLMKKKLKSKKSELKAKKLSRKLKF